ncbi:MAG: L-serine ammonia-lyase, iron-sulfur-dependent, subunit alpha [Lachnospiraceae bacterium]|nr:L-serine ammonia-lyase, iron-sulfur-dependent, subunit alpha [Lachnospiraceae bacterium]
MYEFDSAEEMLRQCEKYDCKISTLMRNREMEGAECDGETVDARMLRALEIMKNAARGPIEEPKKSMSGLLGGEAKKLQARIDAGEALGGPLLSRAMTYAMATLEVNASMGLIVAAPTAGSAGIVPGILLALQEVYELSDGQLLEGLFHAGAIGYLAMRNATVAGAVGGCQAEVGVASAMAASAMVELMGGTPKMCVAAASTVLQNMLGLVCDPVGGLVEYPCQSRNAAGVANAIVAAEIALAGIPQLIPLDEMMEAMYKVGKRLPPELRETALGGCATTPSACAACGGCKSE